MNKIALNFVKFFKYLQNFVWRQFLEHGLNIQDNLRGDISKKTSKILIVILFFSKTSLNLQDNLFGDISKKTSKISNFYLIFLQLKSWCSSRASCLSLTFACFNFFSTTSSTTSFIKYILIRNLPLKMHGVHFNRGKFSTCEIF